jgi:hypothetical protein
MAFALTLSFSIISEGSRIDIVFVVFFKFGKIAFLAFDISK